MRMRAPIRTIEPHTVPFDPCLSKHLVEAALPLLCRDVASPAKGIQRAYEPVNVGVPVQPTPVEPAGFVVLAVRVIVAVLGATDFVAHQQHGRASCKKLKREAI